MFKPLSGLALALLPFCTVAALAQTGENPSSASVPDAPTPLPASSSLPLVQPSSRPGGGQILALNLQQAVLMALQNNRSLRVERLGVRLAETDAEEAAARFDPVLTGAANMGAESALRALGASNDLLAVVTYSQNYALGLQKTFATGTTVALEASNVVTNRQLADRPLNQQISRIGLSVTQSLLQGRDPAVNLAQIRQAELASTLAGYNLRGFAEALVAETETALWNYLQARQQLAVIEASLALTRQQLADSRVRIEVGRLAEIESTTFEAEIALREQELVTARGTVEKQRLALLRLLNPDRSRWASYRLELDGPLGVPDVQLDALEDHIRLALEQRPEIQQTRLEIQRRELEVVRTRDGLLPKLDLFLNLGKTGYSDSFFGSLANLPVGNGFDFNAGVQLNYPLGARAADAVYRRAQFSQQEQEEALSNLEQLIELDVRQAYLEIRIAREQIQASRATVSLQQTRVNAEIERFGAGRGTAFAIAQAQRDLLAAQIAEISAVMDYLKRLTAFYRFEGTLLTRRGLTMGMVDAPLK